jgi:chorismate--pyruvate lyase
VTNPHLGKHQLEPRWQAHTPSARHDAPLDLLDWLLDPASLTSRLQQTCAGQFRVEPVSQLWQRPMLNEAQALGVRPHERCFVREVRLLCDDRPWVFARTVIPVRTLTGPRRRLSRLGKKPLGAVLFADPSMQRSGIEIAKLLPGQALFARATADLPKQPATIWGRRSAFYLNHKPLLVSEIFLPPICPQNISSSQPSKAG